MNFAKAEPVDPCWPGEWREQKAAGQGSRSLFLPTRIREMEEEREQLRRKIAALPQHEPKPLSEHLGYHSMFHDPEPDGAVLPHRLVARFVYRNRLGSIALVPAFNPLDSEEGSYAFPRRFKIEVQESKGKWVGDEQAGDWVEDIQSRKWVEVVNWMDEDFPDPGPYPVFFSDINLEVRQVRITVPQVVRESGVAYYALGEIYLFKQQESQLADNMAAWGPSGIEMEISDTFSMPPLWDCQYLNDGIVGLGLPLSGEKVDAEDFLVTYEDGASDSDRAEFMLDLGRVERIGRIELWPAEAPFMLALPSIGFPRKISVELSTEADFGTSEVIDVENVGERMYRDNLLSIMCEGHDAQYIRIAMENLPEFKGRRILGMGEISVLEYGEVLSVGSKVTAKGIPESGLDQLPRLVDGCSRHRRILRESEWIKGLAKRRPLDRRLAVVELELASARESWRGIQQRFAVGGGVALCLGLVGGLVFQRRQRRRVLDRLKLRITRDLHDEVGSSLGSISLTSEQLEGMALDDGMREELGELSLMAREACASLREVVWVTDQDTIRLPALIEKLVERADRVLRGVKLEVEIPSDCPDSEVSLPFKRHLIMFFREAVHNCARHANATRVRVAVVADDHFLMVSVQDNGCGFDPSAKRDGWGLDSMKKRAEELGGKLDLETRPGGGTSVRLTVPLDVLSKEPSRAYKTSN